MPGGGQLAALADQQQQHDAPEQRRRRRSGPRPSGRGPRRVRQLARHASTLPTVARPTSVLATWAAGRRCQTGQSSAEKGADAWRSTSAGGSARDWRDSRALVAARADAAAGVAQRGAGRPRRRRLRPARLLRLRHRDAGDRRPGRGRRPAGQLPHHVAVLAHPRVPADRAQPPPQRHGPGGRPGDRLSPATGASRRARTATCPRSCAPPATPPTRSASGTCPPRTRPTWRRHARPGRSARGFDRWYGFHGGETHQFVPALYHDNHSVRPPRSIEDGYHLTEDLADRAIEFLGDLRAVDADKPFFLYFATGACHSPHQPPRRWLRALPRPVRRRLGRLARAGVRAPARRWPAARRRPSLSPRPAWVPAWDSLSDRDRAVAARFMECFAGFLSHADEQVGRILAFLRERGELDNTIVCVVSDNGASAEGGAEGSINDVRMVNIDPAQPAEMLARLDEIGGPAHATTTTRGAGRWPATRRSGAGSARSTRAASPTRASSPGRAAAARRARSGTSSRTRSTCCRRCSNWPASGCRPRSTASRRLSSTA